MAATSTMRALAPAPPPPSNSHTAPQRRTLASASTSSSSAARRPPLKPLLAAAPGPATSKKVLLAPAPTSLNRPVLLSLAPAKKKSTQPRSSFVSPQLSRHDSASAPTGVKPMSTANVAGLSSSAEETSSYDSASSLSGSALDVDEDSGSLQPQKEWVLPARAKPGRKPSDVEPPTKRKAQNRASQRAFRERRQSYLASLETKVAEYERRGAAVSTEMQRVARRLKEENEALKKANEALRAEVQRYESMHAQSQAFVKAEDDGIITPLSAGGSGGGLPVSMMLSAPRRSSWDWTKTSPTARAVDKAAVQDERQGGVGGGDGCATMDRDCGFCTEQSLCVCSGEAVLDFAEQSNSGAKESSQEKLSPAVSIPLRRSNDKATRSHSTIWPTQPLRSAPVPAQRPLGRVAQPPQPALPRQRATLWPVYSAPAPPTSASPVVFRMRKQLPGAPVAVCSGDPSDCGACATDPALADFCRAVSAQLTTATPSDGATQTTFLDAGNAVPLRRKRTLSGTTRMQAQSPGVLRAWETQPSRSSMAQVRPLHLYTNGSHQHPPRPKLWTVSRSDEWSAQTVSAPPRFPLTPTSSAPPPPMPLLRRTPTDVDGVESIPEAWQRIKQHPRFSQWQGGLDMLADVVTRRSDGGGDDAHRAFIAPRPASFAQKFWHGSSSADRASGGALGEQQGEGGAVTEQRRQVSNSPPLDEPSSKRRKLYVERKRVDDVLALMDRSASQARHSTSSSPPATAAEQAELQACACPLSKIME